MRVVGLHLVRSSIDSQFFLLKLLMNFHKRLNEGFATLFEYQLMGLVHPDWHTRDFFNIRKLQNAFRQDSRDNARAMTTELLTISDIYGAFDFVVYDKGEDEFG
jgi:aminopeptidase N